MSTRVLYLNQIVDSCPQVAYDVQQVQETGAVRTTPDSLDDCSRLEGGPAETLIAAAAGALEWQSGDR